MQKGYTFNTTNSHVEKEISNAIKNFNREKKLPIIICVGSDLVLGDSLGPLVGTMLKKKLSNVYVYGSLNFPITAKEINYTRDYILKIHPKSITIAIDAAIGSIDDIGQIKVMDKGLKPGLGVEKNLGEIGDLSIIGIVAERSDNNFILYNATRLNLVYKMAEKISDGIIEYCQSVSRTQFYA